MSVITNFLFLFLSFLPLWIAVLFVDIKSIIENQSNLITEWTSIILILLISIISIIVLIKKLNPKVCQNKKTYNIKSAKEEKYITSEFILSYVLPLFVFDFTLWFDVLLFLLFFLVLAFLYNTHHIFTVNIVLEFMSYKVFNCKLVEKGFTHKEDGNNNAGNNEISKLVISNSNLIEFEGRCIDLDTLNNDYFLDISPKKNKENE